MMRALRTATGLCLGLGALALLAMGSDMKLAFHPDDTGRVRLSWRSQGARVERCRAPTAAELEGVPIHMRPKEICEGAELPFQLRAWVDGEIVVDERVTPSGLRADRPAYVMVERPVAAGPHRLRVEFAVASAEVLPGHEPLRLDAELAIAPRRVALVTLDEEGRKLELRLK